MYAGIEEKILLTDALLVLCVLPINYFRETNNPSIAAFSLAWPGFSIDNSSIHSNSTEKIKITQLSLL
jgi:uncharacterized membrane protein